MLPTQSSKAFGLLWGMLGYLVVALFIAAIKRKILIIRITIGDLFWEHIVYLQQSHALHQVKYFDKVNF